MKDEKANGLLVLRRGPSYSAPDWFAAGVQFSLEPERSGRWELDENRSATLPFPKGLGQSAKRSSSWTWPKHRSGRTGRRRYGMLDIALFLEKVGRLSGSDEHRAVDAVYDFMDDRLLEGDFPVCDAALKAAAPEQFLLSVTISFLIVTRRAKAHLPEREAFFNRALAALTKDPDMAEAAQALRKYQ